MTTELSKKVEQPEELRKSSGTLQKNAAEYDLNNKPDLIPNTPQFNQKVTPTCVATSQNLGNRQEIATLRASKAANSSKIQHSKIRTSQVLQLVKFVKISTDVRFPKMLKDRGILNPCFLQSLVISSSDFLRSGASR